MYFPVHRAPKNRHASFAINQPAQCLNTSLALYFPPLSKPNFSAKLTSSMAEPQSYTDENKALVKSSPQQEGDGHTQNNPLLSFVSNIFQLFKPPAPKKNVTTVSDVSESEQSKIGASGSETLVEDESNPVVVKFPKQGLAPVKLEAEAEGGEQNTNPVILWQVYAIGGFFILRWAWKRWNERKGDKKSTDEPPPADD